MLFAVVAAAVLAVQRPLEPESVAFWDLRHGLVAGHEVRPDGRFGRAVVKATSDGGRTWRVVRRGQGPFELAAVRGGRAGWIATPWAFLRTTDRGLSWELAGRAHVSRATFATSATGWALGRTGLGATADGGRSWRPLRGPCGSSSRFAEGAALSLPTPSHGWILCLGQPGTGMQGKAVYETRDGDRSWRLRSRSRHGQPKVGRLEASGYGAGLSFLDDGHGWLPEVRGGFYETRDGGARWRGLPVGVPEAVEAHAAELLDAGSASRSSSTTGRCG